MESVRRSGRHCERLGHEVEVATLDEPGARHVANFPLRVHALGPGAGRYGYTARLAPWLAAEAWRYDGVVVNGLWQYHGFAAWQVLRRLRRAYCVCTHGMLGPWWQRLSALESFRRRLYWAWTECCVLRDAAAVLYASEEERRRARRSLRTRRAHRANERVVAFCPPPPGIASRRADFLRRFPQLGPRRLLLYPGRLQGRHGDLLLEAFARVATGSPDLHLVAAGPDGRPPEASLKDRAEALGIASRITCAGPLRDDAKWAVLHAAEVLVLPLPGEHVGISMAEALGCGLPVLIADRSDVWHEIQQDGAGFVAPRTVEGIERLLRAWLALGPPARARMRANALACFDRRHAPDAMARGLVEVLGAASGET